MAWYGKVTDRTTLSYMFLYAPPSLFKTWPAKQTYLGADLEQDSLVTLLATSKQLRAVARDNDLWKSFCFERITLAPFSRLPLPWYPHNDGAVDDHSADLGQASTDDRAGNFYASDSEPVSRSNNADAFRARSLANWDPSYPGEQVDWYQEYIARYGPISMNWLQIPITRGSGYQTIPESKGLALYATANDQRVISPLDDGSLCLWDISHRHEISSSRGTVMERSAPGLVSTDGKGAAYETSKARQTSTGVVECVSVDNFRQKAYVAVQSGLNEIDLSTMRVSSHRPFPFSISALSEISDSVPLTVGTNLTVHIHDHRQPDTNAQLPSDAPRVDDWSSLTTTNSNASIVHQHAILFQPGPLSILHLNPFGDASHNQGEIFVAGRFPSILIYDRRTFPRLRGTLHSGARLSSMTSLPYSFKLLETDLMRQNQLSIRQAESAKATPGDRVIACGEYNGKGSLEIFGLDAGRAATSPGILQAGTGQNSSFKNRVSASSSKLLSIAKHGTRLLLADSSGNLRWMERNGSTLVRAWNLNHQDQPGDGREFMYLHDPNLIDVARKILPTPETNRGGHADQDEILLWTGERIGLLGFTPQPHFGGDPDLAPRNELQAMEFDRQHRYEQTMRRTLERQADEMRWMERFGQADYL